MAKYIDVGSTAYDYGTLADWLISSVGPEPPVWTEPHIEELIEDFYVVPKSTPPADVAEVRHGRWVEQPPDFDLCGVTYYQCSECGKEQQTPSHYCQFCGARMEGRKWCVWQDEDNEGVYCTAHIHEDRVLNCPYKDLEERQRADYPCQDYKPIDEGGQDE